MTGNAQGPTGAFTDEEERLHAEGFAAINAAMAAGLAFDAACARIDVADPDLRRIIIDDFLKVTIAQRHFQGGESTEQVAGALGIPVERVEFARKEMLAEVAAASVDVFRRQSGQGADA
ncbi:MAG TPA: hypothetical protein VI078_10305 [bacterium]